MLPIKKVVLYKHGVGYFERQGDVEGDASVDLHFKAGEMNDVLKSLTVLDLSQGLIASISYESTKPVERQLQDIAIDLPDENSLTGLLSQIKGARLSVDTGNRQVEGVVTGIETVTRRDGDVSLLTHYLTLLVDGASLQSFEVLELRSLTMLDENLRKDFQHLLEILINAKKKDLKKLTIFTRGQGKRSLLASYVVESPVWKTSYRVILGEDKPLVQGWALVDNTQDEDWEDVALSLVAGLPVSFIHDLYSPRYKRRPVVQVQEEEAYAPPQLESAVEEYPMAEADMYSAGAMPPPPPAPAAPRMAKMASGPAPAQRAAARAQSVQVQTRTVEVGDLFRYEIENPVTVRRGQSALVPILQTSFGGKRVAIYNPEVREKNPMTALLFKNTTGLVLEGGPLTVLENEDYVGESMLDTLKPNEERLVPYSVELGCVITRDHQSELQDVRQVTIVNGTLYLYQYRIERRIYVIFNKNDKPLDLFLDHRFHPNWDLIESEQPVERTDSFYRFRTEVPAGKTTRFVVTERGDETSTYGLQHINRDQVGHWLDLRYLDGATAKVLKELIDLGEGAASRGREAQRAEQEVAEIFRDQERLRQNLQALGSSNEEKDLRAQYVNELKRGEERLKVLRDLIRQATDDKLALEQQLRERMTELSYQTTLAR